MSDIEFQEPESSSSRIGHRSETLAQPRQPKLIRIMLKTGLIQNENKAYTVILLTAVVLLVAAVGITYTYINRDNAGTPVPYEQTYHPEK